MSNLGYIVAGYTITFLLIAGYMVSLLKRLGRARRETATGARL